MIYSKNIRKYRNYRHCKKEGDDDCILWSACDDCWYHELKLICPYCKREIPTGEFLLKNGCIWCQQENVKNE